ncbi:MAG: exodeoxyribonuclease V subunit alpha [Verrucomicrobiota bacterium]|nr:exodeoxyribonuclease V subunit alpha [Verrucomicrobiota bacterium]
MLKKLQELDIFSNLDLRFAELMTELSTEKSVKEDLFLASAVLSNWTTEKKHICLNLEHQNKIKTYYPEIFSAELRKKANLQNWFSSLKKANEVVGVPGDYKPLILSKNLLYLHRYWSYEQMLGKKLLELSKKIPEKLDYKLLRQGLSRVFPIYEQPDGVDWQKVAAFAALKNDFTIITGGPGTGKTTVVAAILVLLAEQNAFEDSDVSGKKQIVKLCAPTGKAATQLQEAIVIERDKIRCSDEIRKKITLETSTIHRLLGWQHNSPYFRHDNKNPLSADVIIVDEASMVPLALMAKLLDAVKNGSKVILLGDRDQLASVEAGSVFADICIAAAGESENQNSFSADFLLSYMDMTGVRLDEAKYLNSLTNCVVELQESHRFDSKRGIGRVKTAISSGDSDLVLKVLQDCHVSEINLSLPPDSLSDMKRKIADYIKRPVKMVESIKNTFLSYLNEDDIESAFSQFNRFRILCATRKGIFGVENVNSIITEMVLLQKDLRASVTYFKGRPILIKKNSYSQGLYNGDIGLCWTAKDGNGISVYFPDSKKTGEFRQFTPAHLPEHETVFAMTIHKSQGSGFENVLIILPDDRYSPVLTRELFYTGITRAKKRVEIWAENEILKIAIQQKIERESGLGNMF